MRKETCYTSIAKLLEQINQTIAIRFTFLQLQIIAPDLSAINCFLWTFPTFSTSHFRWLQLTAAQPQWKGGGIRVARKMPQENQTARALVAVAAANSTVSNCNQTRSTAGGKIRHKDNAKSIWDDRSGKITASQRPTANKQPQQAAANEPKIEKRKTKIITTTKITSKRMMMNHKYSCVPMIIMANIWNINK